jgi:hypothetical protein
MKTKEQAGIFFQYNNTEQYFYAREGMVTVHISLVFLPAILNLFLPQHT